LPARFAHRGAAVLQVRASNQKGEGQPERAVWNPGGYRRHVIESTNVTIS